MLAMDNAIQQQGSFKFTVNAKINVAEQRQVSTKLYAVYFIIYGKLETLLLTGGNAGRGQCDPTAGKFQVHHKC